MAYDYSMLNFHHLIHQERWQKMPGGTDRLFSFCLEHYQFVSRKVYFHRVVYHPQFQLFLCHSKVLPQHKDKYFAHKNCPDNKHNLNTKISFFYYYFFYLSTHFNFNDNKNPSRTVDVLTSRQLSQAHCHWRNVLPTSLNTKCSIKIFFQKTRWPLQKIPQIYTLLRCSKYQQKYKTQR